MAVEANNIGDIFNLDAVGVSRRKNVPSLPEESIKRWREYKLRKASP